MVDELDHINCFPDKPGINSRRFYIFLDKDWHAPEQLLYDRPKDWSVEWLRDLIREIDPDFERHSKWWWPYYRRWLMLFEWWINIPWWRAVIKMEICDEGEWQRGLCTPIAIMNHEMDWPVSKYSAQPIRIEYRFLRRLVWYRTLHSVRMVIMLQAGIFKKGNIIYTPYDKRQET